MKAVAVFFGGQSVEHDVSVITGVLTVNSIDKSKYNVIPIYVHTDGVWYTGESLIDLDEYEKLDLKKLRRVALFGGSNVLYVIKGKKIKELDSIWVAINCMHGERGEDGSLSGILKTCKIACASPDLLASSVCMDKNFTKIFLRGLKVKTLPCVTVKSLDEWENLKSKPEYPVIVKPTCLGSSIGISVAENNEELSRALSYALKFSISAVVEPCLKEFKEINCAAYLKADGTVNVSECERPVGRTEILSFGDKYEGGKRIFPADIDPNISDKIKKITEKVYLAMDTVGVIRIDYFVCGKEIYLNEINTVPGSLAYYLFGDTLKSFTLMLDELINVADKKFIKQSSLSTDYKSGILKGHGSKGAKRL